MQQLHHLGGIGGRHRSRREGGRASAVRREQCPRREGCDRRRTHRVSTSRTRHLPRRAGVSPAVARAQSWHRVGRADARDPMATMAPHASPTRILAAARPSAVRRTRTGDAVASRPGSRARTRRSSRRARRVRTTSRANSTRRLTSRRWSERRARPARARGCTSSPSPEASTRRSPRTSSIAPSGTETGTETETVTGAFPGTGSRARVADASPRSA